MVGNGTSTCRSNCSCTYATTSNGGLELPQWFTEGRSCARTEGRWLVWMYRPKDREVPPHKFWCPCTTLLLCFPAPPIMLGPSQASRTSHLYSTPSLTSLFLRPLCRFRTTTRTLCRSRLLCSSICPPSHQSTIRLTQISLTDLLSRPLPCYLGR